MRAPRHLLFLLAVFAMVSAIAAADTSGYTPVPLIEVGKPPLVDIAYSPDGSVLATLTTDWIELLDAQTFEPVARFPRAQRGGGEGSIQYSPDGAEVVVLGRRIPCAFYDAATGGLKDETPPTSGVYAISPDFRRVAYAEGDVVTVWSRDVQDVVAILTGDPEPGLLSVSLPNNGTVSVSTPRVRALAFHPDSVRLLVASDRETVALWDTSSGELQKHFRFRRTWPRVITVRPNGDEFAVFTEHQTRFVWRFDDAAPEPLASLPQMGLPQYDRSGRYLWTVGSDGIRHRLDTDDGSAVTGWERGAPDEHAAYTEKMSFDPTGRRVATWMEDRGGARIGIWSADTLRVDRVLDHAWGAGIRTASALYLPQHGQVVTVGSIARRWDISRPGAFAAWEFRARPNGTTVSSDESVAVTPIWPSELRVFIPTTGQNLGSIDFSPASRVAVSATGRFIAGLGSRTGVWSVAGLRRIATLDTPDPNLNTDELGFTPSERRLVIRTTSRSGDGTLQVWDIATSALLMTVPGGGPFAATEHGIVHVVRQEGSWKEAAFEVRRVGDPAPISVIPPMRAPFRGNVYGATSIDPSGKYVMVRDEDPATHEPTVRFHSADTGALLGTRPYALNIAFAGGGDYLFAKGPNGGRALYRTEEFLNIPSHDVTPRNKLLAAWGDIKRTQLLPAYPNPFNPETWIPFDLAAPALVEMVIYNDLGRATRSISLGQLPAGAYRTRERAAHWDGRNDAGERVASGAYFIELRAGQFRQTRRVTLTK